MFVRLLCNSGLVLNGAVQSSFPVRECHNILWSMYVQCKTDVCTTLSHANVLQAPIKDMKRGLMIGSRER